MIEDPNDERLYIREYAMLYHAFNGKTTEDVPKEQAELLWKTLKRMQPLASDVSQSSGIANRTYKLKGKVYDCLWHLYTSKEGDPPFEIVEIKKMLPPKVRKDAPLSKPEIGKLHVLEWAPRLGLRYETEADMQRLIAFAKQAAEWGAKNK